MNYKKLRLALLFAATIFALGINVVRPLSAAETNVTALINGTDFHGIAVDSKDSSRIYLATHHGLFVVAPNGEAERVSDMSADFMGFTPHPSDPNIFFASGHPAKGGNLGVIVSKDGGKSWKKIADAIGGPVDFHQMDVSKANPDIVIGNSRGLQMSKDAGQSWKMVGPMPEGTIDLAASASDENSMYAATQSGIVKSEDGGLSWVSAHPTVRTTTMIDSAADGKLYAFQIGTGLIRKDESSPNWELVTNNLRNEFILHFAVDSSNQQNMYAVTFNQQSRKLSIAASSDGGANWKTLGGK